MRVYLGPLFALSAMASDAPYVEKLIQQIETKHLYNEKGWQKTLLIVERRLGPSQSLFDDPRYFLNEKHSRTDARLEMLATVRKFASPELMTIDKETRHAQCFFPARLAFLREHLQLDPMPMQACPELKKYLKFAHYTGASLVFSNYFAGNPASMFGHTLLRLHRSTEGDETGLLDDAANFAALIPSINPVTYPIKGLFGFFKGRFALLPYDQKIQEYNNHESRDLWEYELNLSREELDRLALALYEFGSFESQYYYLTKNCSYVILALLEAAKPNLELVSPFHIYAIPSDTVKVVTDQPNFVKSVQFKPSAQTRYLERAQLLNLDQKALFKQITTRFEKRFSKSEFQALLETHDEKFQVPVLDAVIEYIDFKEKKFSTKELSAFGELRGQALLARSRAHVSSSELTYRPEKSRPDLGPRSSLVGFLTGFTREGYNLSEFQWRPALHDSSSSALGYSDQLEIQVLDTVIGRSSDINQIYLKHLSLLGLQSLGQHHLGIKPISWHFDINFNNERSLSNAAHLVQRTGAQVGFGEAYFLGPFGVFLMLDVLGGYSTELYMQSGFGPNAGVFYSFSDQLKFSTCFWYLRFFGETMQDRHEVTSRLSYAWHRENETALEFRNQDGFDVLNLNYRFYY